MLLCLPTRSDSSIPGVSAAEENAAAPEGFETKKATGKGLENYTYRIQVSPLDCLGCGACVQVCPAKEKALTMKPLDSQAAEEVKELGVRSILNQEEKPTGKEHRKRKSVRDPVIRVLRRMCRLRRDTLRKADDPDVRRPHGDRQRNRLYPGMGRSASMCTVYHQ